MVEQHPIAGIHPVGLAVIHRDPVAIQLGHRIGAAGIEGGGFLLGDFLHQAIELAGAGLVDARFLGEAQHAHRLQDPQGAEGIAVGGVLRRLKAHRHMALGPQVVDLIGLHLLDDPDQVGAVGEVAVVQHQPRVGLVGILVEVINAAGVETAGPALDAMHHIALLQQQLRQITAVLPRDAGDQGHTAAAIHARGVEGHGLICAAAIRTHPQPPGADTGAGAGPPPVAVESAQPPVGWRAATGPGGGGDRPTAPSGPAAAPRG